MRKILLVFSLFVFLVPLSYGQKELVVDYLGTPKGATIQLAKDQILVIKLPTTPSNGYSWSIQSMDKKILEADPEVNFVTENENSIGAEGSEVFRFKALSAGSAEIKFVYRRPWEKATSFDVTYSVKTEGAYTGNVVFEKNNYTAPQYKPSQSKSLPSSFSWLDQGGTTTVKDQGSCGGCWSFAACGVFEGNIKQKDGVERDLSEQFLISCNSDGWGCNGGYNPFDYFIDKVVSGDNEAGAVYESDFPYQASDVSCNAPYTHHEKADSWAWITDGSSVPSVDEIKSAIYNHGLVWCAVYVDNAFQSYTGGVFQGSSNSQPNHAVVLVGWDDANQCWIMRNSWGPNWGENGYMRIKYGANNIGYAAAYLDYSGNGGGGGGTTPSYCTSQGNNVNYEWISKVQIGDFSNSSGAQGYTDFTSKTIDMASGQDYSVTLTPGFASSSYNEYFRVWIDLNADGDFDDANELVYDEGSAKSTSATGTITIPAGTSAKTTRMRVSMKYNGAPTACETFSYGEVEDYTVNITASTVDNKPPSAPSNLSASNITETTVDLSWTASSDNVGVTGYDVYENGSLLGSVTGTSAQVTGLTANTSYSFYVKAKDAAGNISDASNTINVTTIGGDTGGDMPTGYCSSKGNSAYYEWIDYVKLGSIDNPTGSDGGYADYTNLSTNVNRGSSYTLTVSAGFRSSSYTEYWTIYIDWNRDGDFDDSGEEIAKGYSSSAANLTATVNVPSDASLGTTRMRISMKYNAYQTPCETFSYGEVEDYALVVGNSYSATADNSSAGKELGEYEDIVTFDAYPNPFSSVLTINSPFDNSSYEIFNSVGQVVMKGTMNTHTERLNTSKLANGLYTIRITDGQKVIVNKVSKQ